MVEAAQGLAGQEILKGSTSFRVGDITQLPADLSTFDIVYTERTLINLPDTQSQLSAIGNIGRLLTSGGRYLMCENSKEGLRRINALRTSLELPEIKMPWHNCYIDDEAMQRFSSPALTLERVMDFSSTYYLLSRIINAALAAQRGEEPKYDDPVNALAMKLPALVDGLGQTKLWIWRKP